MSDFPPEEIQAAGLNTGFSINKGKKIVLFLASLLLILFVLDTALALLFPADKTENVISEEFAKQAGAEHKKLEKERKLPSSGSGNSEYNTPEYTDQGGVKGGFSSATATGTEVLSEAEEKVLLSAFTDFRSFTKETVATINQINNKLILAEKTGNISSSEWRMELKKAVRKFEKWEPVFRNTNVFAAYYNGNNYYDDYMAYLLIYDLYQKYESVVIYTKNALSERDVDLFKEASALSKQKNISGTVAKLPKEYKD
ncbi:MAG: hypothetical protein C4589_06115 [Peptococcaceae bacterium]|nr:MAG: hypothetical protein C4589_06115 [Peptococcaceae bacterium]